MLRLLIVALPILFYACTQSLNLGERRNQGDAAAADTSPRDTAADDTAAEDAGTSAPQTWRHLDDSEFELLEDFEGAGTAFFGAGREAAPCPSDPAATSRSFRFLFPARAGGSSENSQNFQFPLNVVELELQYRVFVPSNYDHSRDGSSNNAFYYLWNGEEGIGPSSLFIGSDHWPNFGGSSRPSFNIGTAASVDGHETLNSITFAYHDGAWHHFRVYVGLARAEGEFGRVVMYWDGEEIGDSRETGRHTEKLPYTETGNYIDRGQLFGWANSGFDVDTIFCVDDFAVRANSAAFER